MKLKLACSILILLLPYVLQAQTEGVVVDNQTSEPLPLVNVWVHDENIGITADEKGHFQFTKNLIGKSLIFNKVGYENYTAVVKDSIIRIELKRVSTYNFDLNETRPRGPRRKILGEQLDETKGVISAGNVPTISGRYFPAEGCAGYSIEKLEILFDSEIGGAKINLRFYSVNEKGFPDQYLYNKDVLVKVGKGKLKRKIKLKDLNIRVPETGLFIGIEHLIILENKFDFEEKNLLTDEVVKRSGYQPSIALLQLDEPEKSYVYTDGAWHLMKISKLNLAMRLYLKKK